MQPFEVVAATAPAFADQRTLDRLSTQEEAERRAQHHLARHPGQACFVFHHVTERTRLLTFHTLYRAEED